LEPAPPAPSSYVHANTEGLARLLANAAMRKDFKELNDLFADDAIIEDSNFMCGTTFGKKDLFRMMNGSLIGAQFLQILDGGQCGNVGLYRFLDAWIVPASAPSEFNNYTSDNNGQSFVQIIPTQDGRQIAVMKKINNQANNNNFNNGTAMMAAYQQWYNAATTRNVSALDAVLTADAFYQIFSGDLKEPVIVNRTDILKNLAREAKLVEFANYDIAFTYPSCSFVIVSAVSFTFYKSGRRTVNKEYIGVHLNSAFQVDYVVAFDFIGGESR